MNHLTLVIPSRSICVSQSIIHLLNLSLLFLLILWKHIILACSYTQLLFFLRDTLSSLVLLSMKLSEINVKQITQTFWPMISSSVKFWNVKWSSIFSRLCQSQQINFVPTHPRKEMSSGNKISTSYFWTHVLISCINLASPAKSLGGFHQNR